MTNVGQDRRVEHDWWTEPIPPNVEFGDGFYCETAQVFRFLRNRKAGAIKIGKHCSVYSGCSFSIGTGGQGGGAHTREEWYQPDGRDLGLRRILLVLAALAAQNEESGAPLNNL